MLLRTRLSVLGALVVIVVALSFLFAGIQREELIRAQYSDEVINHHLNLWTNINDEFVERMTANLWLMKDNQQLIEALQNKDVEKVRLTSEKLIEKLRAENIADRFDVLYFDGSLAYSSHSAVFQSPIIDPSVASEAIRRLVDLNGVSNDAERNIAIIAASPLVSSETQEIVGLGIFATNIAKALIEMEVVNASTVMIVNRRGRLLVASEPTLWEQVSELINLSEINSQQTISVDNIFFSVIVLPQVANLGSLVGRLLNISDVTDYVNEQEKISQYTLGMLALFTLLSLLSLSIYLSRAFVPIHEGVRVLDALSKGDTDAHIEHVRFKDEVGQIAQAVNLFRAKLIEFNRYRRSRERQRARQERFIHREMTKLANTLEGDDKQALLAELNQIGKVVTVKVARDYEEAEQSRLDQGDNSTARASELGHEQSDSLAMVALAFQSLSTRIRDQNRRLREALATKEALMLIRKELDIATRVQLSLLPEKIAGTSSFDLYGGMWPAKEVGGDFLDYFRLDENRIGVAIADVSGKGVPAALFTVMTRTLLHSTVSHVESPGKVLEAVNTFLEDNNDENLFVTLFYAIFDERTGRVHYANGGHNPPIVLDSQGANMLKTTDGIVLGMFGGFEFEDTYIDLEPGARLVMMTDGIPEAFNGNNEIFGDQRTLDTVAKLPDSHSAEEDVNFIVNEVNEFVGSAPQFDDIACIVLHYLEPKVTH